MYTGRLTNAVGCDSIVSLNLTINQPKESTSSVSACDSYFWSVTGASYTSSGSYSEVFTAANGCDSIVRLELQITKLDTGVSQRFFEGELRLRSNELGASYQWFDCSNGLDSIREATSQNFVPLNPGSFAVRIAKNSCTSLSTCVDVLVLSQVEQQENYPFELYPNPSTGAFEIDLGKVEPHTEVAIYSTNGKLVYNNTFSHQQKLSFDLKLNSAVYFIEVVNDSNRRYNRRFVVSN